MRDPVIHMLAECLEKIESGERSVEDCLRDYPAYRDELDSLLSVARDIQDAPAILPQPEYRRAARARLLVKINAGRSVTIQDRLRFIWQNILFTYQRRPTMSWILIFTTIAALLTGGTAYAADWAAPGDPLYIIDRSVENVRLGLTRDPYQALQLQLAFATERLDEAATLTRAGDFDHLREAFQNYGAMMAQATNAVHQMENGEQERFQARVAQTLRLQEGMLARVFQDGEAPADDRLGVCEREADHPVAQKLSQTYEVPYEDIMVWFCQGGYGFGEIMLALEGSQTFASDLTPDELLALKDELGGWGEVWNALDLLFGPGPGPGPENRENRPDDAPFGPPDEIPLGPPDEVPVGPRGNPGGDPPDEVPVGPPDEVPVGPPDEVPVGPPDHKPGGNDGSNDDPKGNSGGAHNGQNGGRP